MFLTLDLFYEGVEACIERILFFRIIRLISILLLFSVTVPAEDMPHGFREADLLTICLPADVETLDPANHRSRITQIVLKNIFDSLTARDADNRVIPQLAEDWRLINDTEWEFRLRKGVRFHNGEELKASDIAFTLHRIINNSPSDFTPSPRKGLFLPVSDVIVHDDYTVIIKTSYPWPNLPLMLSLQEILPESYIASVGLKKFNEMPVGTGPFKFVHREKNKEIILERFEDYYGGSPERPPVQIAPIKHLVFRIVPSYLDQVSMLKQKKCNLMFNIPPELVPILEMTGDINILKIPATRCVFADINCSRTFFKDSRTRKALNYAVDVESIVSQKFMGKAQILSTLFLPRATGFNGKLKPYTYNPETAIRLLKAADFPFMHVISIYTNQNELLFADGISVYLTKLGLKTEVKVVPDIRPHDTGPNAPWDIFISSWGNSTLDPMGIVVPKLQSRGSANFSGFVSGELDMMMDEVQKTMSESLRENYFQRIQEIIFNEAPMIFGYAPDEYYAVTNNVKNFKPSITGMLEMHDVVVEERKK